MVSIIVAAAQNNAIGKDNALLWHLPDDWRFFKQVTLGHPVVMGRKTFESLKGPLKERENIVVTRDRDYSGKGIKVVHSLEDGLRLAVSFDEDEIFVIGGGDLYRQALPYTDRVYLTRVNATPDGDAFFPELDEKVWEKVEEVKHDRDERHKYSFSFVTYRRIGMPEKLI